MRNEVERRYSEHDHDIDVSVAVFGLEELDEIILVFGTEKTICVEMLGIERNRRFAARVDSRPDCAGHRSIEGQTR